MINRLRQSAGIFSVDRRVLNLIWAIVLCCCLIPVVSAQSPVIQDTLTSVLARMRPQQAVKIYYQEKRFIALLTEPWQGSGYIYAALPHSMVKEQWYPQRELMGAHAEMLLYFDPFAKVRHQMTLTMNDPMGLYITAFKAMLTGDQALLQKFFEIEFKAADAQNKNWSLLLKAKKTAHQSLTQVSISGPAGKEASSMSFYMQDGDRTEFSFQKQTEGSQPQLKIKQLLLELQEN